MKLKYEIFVPEKGESKDIKFNHEYEWDHNLELYPLGKQLGTCVEAHVDEEGLYHYKEFNQLFVDLICDVIQILGDEDDKFIDILRIFMQNPPFGPVGLKTRSKKIIAAFKEAIEDDKKRYSEDSDEEPGEIVLEKTKEKSEKTEPTEEPEKIALKNVKKEVVEEPEKKESIEEPEKITLKKIKKEVEEK